MTDIAFNLNREDKTPLFKQIYEFIRTEIIRGRLLRNEKLPSKRQLAARLQCSLNTVEAAYSQLAKLDDILIIEKEQKKDLLPLSGKAKYKYDFSHQGVDYDSFPFSVWRRITKEVINEYDRDILRIGDSQGSPGLRMSIARYLHHSRGVNCVPEQIIISAGTEFLLQLLIQLFDEDFIYAIENPGYEKLNMIFRSSRAVCRPIDLDSSGMRPDCLDKTMANAACVTPSHQIPTGRIMPVSRRIQLLNWTNENPRRYIIEDDYDSEFRYSGKPIPSLQGLDKNGRVIYIGAFSKSLSPALRISYMVLPEHLLKIYHEKLSFYICPVSTIAQKTLQQFIEKGHFERHLNKMRKIYRQKREVIVSAINDMLPGAEIQGDSAGLHFILRIQNGMNEQELIERAGNQHVKVYGISGFYSDQTSNKHDGALLIGFGALSSKEITDAVSLLKRAWYK